jgi:glycosyltransferase involved in cell wall biosynthesis
MVKQQHPHRAILATSRRPGMAIALLTNYLTPYRMPLYERLADRHGVEVLCFGGGGRYVPPWFEDLDAQLRAAPFPALRLAGVGEALALGRRYEAVIAPFAGGPVLLAAYAGARAHRRRFVLWASVWAQPRSVAHALALPATRRIYRDADAVLAYGEHVRRFVAAIRGRDEDVFVAPQAVEPLFACPVGGDQLDAFRARHALPRGPLAIYVGRLVAEKGVGVLLEAARRLPTPERLVLIGDGPLAARAAAAPGVRLIGPLERERLRVAYAAAACAILPSIPTPRFREPWGLVCNEAMHQGRPVIATPAVGAVAGGLVRDRVSGLVVPAGDPAALAAAIAALLEDAELRRALGVGARAAVAPYTYEAAEAAFACALATARGRARRY